MPSTTRARPSALRPFRLAYLMPLALAMGCGIIAWALGLGCGMIADKDRIKVAKIADRYITRGDLYKVIREMSDAEPLDIRTKGDMLRVLNGHIDECIKLPLGQEVERELQQQHKQQVIQRLALGRFIKEHAEEKYAKVLKAKTAEEAGMSQQDFDAVKQEMTSIIEQLTHEIEAQLAGPDRARLARQIAEAQFLQVHAKDKYGAVLAAETPDAAGLPPDEFERLKREVASAIDQLAAQMEQRFDGKRAVLVSRQQAMQSHFRKLRAQDPDADVDYAAIYNLKDPSVMGLTDVEFQMMKEELDIGIDRELEALRGNAAVAYRATQALKNGTLRLDDADFETEYRLRKNELKRLEWLKFRAFRFDPDTPDAEVEAAKVRKRLDSGEAFDDLIKEYAEKNPNLILEDFEIENNPAFARFRGFWLNASGCEKGDVIGPVFMPQYQVMVQAKGRTASHLMPAAYLVLQVLEHRPETQLTLNEAKTELVATIAFARMMNILREENGVEIYDDELPDPSMFERRTSDTGKVQF